MTALLQRVTGGVAIQPAWLVPVTVAVLALLMALSPLTVVMLLALAALIVFSVRGLDGTERTLVLTLVIAAVVIRLAVLVWLFTQSHPGEITSFAFDGDGLWVKRRSLWIRNQWLGIPLHPKYLEDAFTLYGWSSWIYLLAYLQFLLGESPYAVHLVSVWCFVAAAVLLHRGVRRWFGPIAAMATFATVLFLPSWLMWSVAAMRESYYLLALTVWVVAAVRASHGPTDRSRLAAFVVVALSMWFMSTVRVGGAVILAAVLPLALAGAFVSRRPYLLLAAVLLIVPIGFAALQSSRVQSAAMDQLYRAATVHRGNWVEEGHSYRLLDDRLYYQQFREDGYPIAWSITVRTMTWPEMERFVARSLVAYVLVPLPWQAASRSELLFIPQQMVWLVLVVLAAIGTVRALRTHVAAAWVLLALIVASAALTAPNEGNIGTLVRHRDTVVPFVVCLSALGLLSLLRWAGLTWPVAIDAAAARPTPAIGRWRRAIAASRAAGIARRSRTARVMAAVLDPVIGYRDDEYSAIQRYPVDALAPWVRSCRIGRVSMGATGFVHRAWLSSSASRIATGVVRQLRSASDEQQVRLAAVIALAASLAAGLWLLTTGQGWPVAVVWTTVTALIALAYTAARPLGAALHQKRAQAHPVVAQALA